MDSSGGPQEQLAPRTDVLDHRQFAQATCTCGWVGSARRSRNRARVDAQAHAAIHPSDPETGEPSGSASGLA